MELALRADALDAAFGEPGSANRPALRSLYLGGGTPSLLPAEAVAGLIEQVRARYGLAPDAEVTIEANPGPDERGDAAALAAAGVTRISFGAQSLVVTELRRLGRRHVAGDVADAAAGARDAGIASVNLDLLYDIPDQTEADWAASLDAALALEPDHLSLYALTLDDPDAEGLTGPAGDHLPTTAGARRWRGAARPRQDEDRAAAMYLHAFDRLAAAGFRGYEISNWARRGHESQHNLAYWERLPVEAVGPGAHAFDGVTRRWNAARLDAWMVALTPGDGTLPRLPPGSSETLDAASAERERLILGLRTDAGIEAGAAEATGTPHAAALRWGIETGLLSAVDGDRLVLTRTGRLLSNELFNRLV